MLWIPSLQSDTPFGGPHVGAGSPMVASSQSGAKASGTQRVSPAPAMAYLLPIPLGAEGGLPSFLLLPLSLRKT